MASKDDLAYKYYTQLKETAYKSLGAQDEEVGNIVRSIELLVYENTNQPISQFDKEDLAERILEIAKKGGDNAQFLATVQQIVNQINKPKNP